MPNPAAATEEPPVHHRLTAANKISLARLVGVPIFALIFAYYRLSLIRGQPAPALRWWAFAIFLLLALSDLLDGYLARSRHEVTHLGRLLDPLADKLLALTALLFLTQPSLTALTPQFPLGFTILVLSREVFLMGGAALIQALAHHVDVRPSWVGKAASAALGLCIVAALAGLPQPQLNVGLGLTALMVVISTGQYLVAGIRQLEQVPGLLHREPPDRS